MASSGGCGCWRLRGPCPWRGGLHSTRGGGHVVHQLFLYVFDRRDRVELPLAPQLKHLDDFVLFFGVVSLVRNVKDAVEVAAKGVGERINLRLFHPLLQKRMQNVVEKVHQEQHWAVRPPSKRDHSLLHHLRDACLAPLRILHDHRLPALIDSFEPLMVVNKSTNSFSNTGPIEGAFPGPAPGGAAAGAAVVVAPGG